MDTLTNYITERIRIDNIKHREFPVDGTVKDMVKFLKMNGFEEFGEEDMGVVKQFNKEKIRGFMMNRDKDILWFADTTKNQISENNPVFLIFRYGNTNELYYDNENLDKPRNESDLLEMVNKRFGF